MTIRFGVAVGAALLLAIGGAAAAMRHRVLKQRLKPAASVLGDRIAVLASLRRKRGTQA